MNLCPESCAQYTFPGSCSCGNGTLQFRSKLQSKAERRVNADSAAPAEAWVAHCKRIGLDPETEPHFSIFEAGFHAGRADFLGNLRRGA